MATDAMQRLRLRGSGANSSTPCNGRERTAGSTTDAKLFSRVEVQEDVATSASRYRQTISSMSIGCLRRCRCSRTLQDVSAWLAPALHTGETRCTWCEIDDTVRRGDDQ